MRREYLGQAGHFIASNRCLFHLHTHVNGYCVSTVGEYFVRSEDTAPTTIGPERLYETMVFVLDAAGEPDYWDNVDFGAYNDRDAASRGHALMVCKMEEASPAGQRQSKARDE